MSTTFDAIRDQQRDTWDKFSVGWKKWDDTVMTWLAPFGAAMIAKAGIKDGDAVLDIAAGTGEPGLTVAQRYPKSTVTVTDLSPEMLAIAADNASSRRLSNFRTQIADAGALPFRDASFDAVLCRFGFMFFPSVAQSTSEFARVAKPGAHVVTAVWTGPEQNRWASLILSTIGRHVELPTPSADTPGLFRCAATGMIEKAFETAGLKDVTSETIESVLSFDSAETYWGFMCEIAAPVVAGLAKVNDGTRERIRQEVIAQARIDAQGGAVRFGSSARVICGRKA
jgi:ubiquinone/menaquinone biosynthesis C-methylase UbiE